MYGLLATKTAILPASGANCSANHFVTFIHRASGVFPSEIQSSSQLNHKTEWEDKEAQM